MDVPNLLIATPAYDGKFPAQYVQSIIGTTLPSIDGPDTLRQASARIVSAVAAGELMPSEGEALTKLLDGHLRLVELNDLAVRIAALEQTNLAKGSGRCRCVD